MNDWQADSDLLNLAIPKMQELDRMEYRLRLIQHETTPEQQKAIKEVVPEIIVLTDTMNHTIRYINNHEDYLWNPLYHTYTQEMFDAANQIDKYLRQPSEYLPTPTSLSGSVNTPRHSRTFKPSSPSTRRHHL